MAAAVILGIGLLIGLAWRISLPSSERQEPETTTLAIAVGRITSLADCQWSKQGSGVRGPGSGEQVVSGQWPVASDPPSALRPLPFEKTIFLGDRFLVSSGLMEITYDTGAKVILQGPCSYEIDSDRSGYLAVGRMTAKVDKRAEKADHYQLSTTNYQLFSVRTPTATVTDLGTEFGVEVEESGATRSHVFQGSVEVRSSTSRRLTTSGEIVEILHAGESARVEQGRNRKVIITREPGQPDRFVRRITSSFIPPAASLNQSPSSLLLHPSSFAYRLTDLGALGGKKSYATSINAAGQVVGAASNASGTLHAYLYSDGVMRNLGVPGVASYAYDINERGQIVGQYDTAHLHRHAFLYSNGATKSLGSLGGHRSCAQAINDIGHVVGCSARSNGVDRAFRYTTAKGMQSLGALGGPNAMSRAMGINVRGMVTGYSETHNRQMHAFLYDDADGMVDLGTLGGNISWGCDINSAGLIAGLSTDQGNQLHTVCFGRRAEIRDFGHLCDFSKQNNLAVHMNNAGQVIASFQITARGVTTTKAFLYRGGIALDINLLVAPNHGWTNLYASAINDSGQIAGNGVAPDGSTRAFLLTPYQKERNGLDGKGRSRPKAPILQQEDL